MADEQTKPAFKSLGVLGSLGTIISGVGGAVAILKNFDPETIVQVKALIALVITSGTAIVTGVMTLIARLRPQIQTIQGLFKQQ